MDWRGYHRPRSRSDDCRGCCGCGCRLRPLSSTRCLTASSFRLLLICASPSSDGLPVQPERWGSASSLAPLGLSAPPGCRPGAQFRWTPIGSTCQFATWQVFPHSPRSDVHAHSNWLCWCFAPATRYFHTPLNWMSTAWTCIDIYICILIISSPVYMQSRRLLQVSPTPDAKLLSIYPVPDAKLLSTYPVPDAKLLSTLKVVGLSDTSTQNHRRAI